jgi:hypothetical protein
LGSSSRASHPADQEPDGARQDGDRPSSTDLELPLNSHSLLSNPVVHSIRATSRRTPRLQSRGRRGPVAARCATGRPERRGLTACSPGWGRPAAASALSAARPPEQATARLIMALSQRNERIRVVTRIGRFRAAKQSSRRPGVAGKGVTQAPRWQSSCGCSPANKQVGASSIRANVPRGWAAASTSVSSTKTSAQPWQTGHPLPPSRHLRRAVSRRRRLCKQASSSRPVRRRAAAHKRRPAVIWRADLSFRVPVSDSCGRASRLRCVSAGPRSAASTRARSRSRKPQPSRAIWRTTPQCAAPRSSTSFDQSKSSRSDSRQPGTASARSTTSVRS